ncbi:hypothetical protein DPF_1459 [Desulfoplanes formicivorans]|uniref:Uncharacterized protein n=1 Tax=Desulfoplanes formicivorans TaxID=1592317 RepID=A0A194AHD6_9BACT|nr:hypothetical protein DPF_1459 [Desulfoplanes formicivorans]
MVGLLGCMGYQNQGERKDRSRKGIKKRRREKPWRVEAVSSSFIRTVTVGPGLSPGLLTFLPSGSARGLPGKTGIPPVGNCTPP